MQLVEIDIVDFFSSGRYNYSDYKILDVREESEYIEGHIKKSIFIPRGILEFAIEEGIPDRKSKIAIYCREGKRSALAASTLLKLGYSNVISLNGGWDEYSKKMKIDRQ